MLSPMSLAASGLAIFLPSTFAVLPSAGNSSAVVTSSVFAGFVLSFGSAALQSLLFAGACLSSLLATLLSCGGAGSAGGDVSSIRLSNGDGAQSDGAGRATREAHELWDLTQLVAQADLRISAV